MRFLIIFIFLLSSSHANEAIDIKNLVINKEPRKYDSLTFLDAQEKQLDLNDYRGNLNYIHAFLIALLIILSLYFIKYS